MADITPPDYATTIGQVRLLIPDTEQLADPQNPSNAAQYLFSDSQIQAFITIERENIKRAAAQAKLVLATSEALINKVIKTDDLMTDGAKLGAELRAQAAELRSEADRDDLLEASDAFDVVEFPKNISIKRWGVTWH